MAIKKEKNVVGKLTQRTKTMSAFKNCWLDAKKSEIKAS